jgi:hypothetical protein
MAGSNRGQAGEAIDLDVEPCPFAGSQPRIRQTDPAATEAVQFLAWRLPSRARPSKHRIPAYHVVAARRRGALPTMAACPLSERPSSRSDLRSRRRKGIGRPNPASGI